MTFANDGVAFPLGVLDDEEVLRFRGEYDRLAEAHGGSLKRFDRAHLFFRWAYDLALHPRVVEAVSSILGDDVVVWGSLILSKPPHDDGYVAWHQDGAYAGFLGEATAVSAWIAFSESNAESGCMRVIPGSHRLRLAHAVRDEPRNMLSHGQEIAVEVDEREAVDIVLRPGEMSLHHVDIIHGSNANRASWARTGFIVRYTTPQMLRSVTPVLIARGRTVTHLDVLHEPPSDDFDTALANYRDARR